MNELHEFFNSVAKEKKKVEEEKIRFTPRVNIDLSTDLSSFFGTVSEARKEHVIIAKRDSTKLDALKGFFTRLDHFENSLAENIEKQKDGFDPEEVKYDIETPTPVHDDEELGTEEGTPNSTIPTEEVVHKSVSEVSQDILEPITEVKQVEVKPINYFGTKTRPEPKVEETDVNSLARAMSGLIKKPDELNEQPQLSDLEKLQLEFKQFRKMVTMQMASIGGGGEVRLLDLDDVDTSSLGNGKFLAFNSTTKKLEFTDQVDGN